MSNYYVDTSALIKRYFTEPGSEWVKEIVHPRAENVIIVCDLTPVEFFSAMARRLREGSITSEYALILQNGFLADFEREYLSVPLENDVLRIARDLLLIPHYSLRSLDSLQLASAIAARDTLGERMTFVSGDKNLLAVASEGFDIDNPNDHL